MRKAFSDIFTSVASVTVAVLLIVSAVFCGTALMAFQKTENDRQNEIIAEADILSALDTENPLPTGNVYIFSENGTQTFHRGNEPLPEYINTEIFLTHTESELSTMDGQFEKPMFHVVKPVDSSYIVIANIADKYNAFLSVIVTVIILADIFAICVIFVVVYFVAKRFISPIEEMTEKVAAIESGDFSARVPVESDSEIGFLADSLNRMADTIEHTENERSAFIANVSHELRTPMTTISGFIDGIMDGTIPEEEHDKYLKQVSTETKRLSRLVTNMLTLSAYDAGKMDIKHSRFDILPEFLNVLTHQRDELIKKNITVNAPERTEFYVTGDPDLLSQVIYNLIENAVKFTETDGEIDITFNESEHDSTIRIKNTGAGLRADEITRVFDRFYKADASRGKDKYGAGLGLSIVSGIIKLHQGKLIVKSEPDKFTEFEITLFNE